VKRAAIAVSVSLSMAPTAAFAVDWTVKATESETVEANSNLFLATPPAAGLGSYTTLFTNFEARTPDSKFNFDADGNYRKYWGPATDNDPTTESTNWGFRAHYEMDGENKFDREFAEVDWRQQSAAFALLNEFGILNKVDGALDRLTAIVGIDRSLSARDSINLLATSTHISYEPSTSGTPLTDSRANATWRHSLSSNSALTASSEVEMLNFDNAFGTVITILRDQVGVQASLSPLLSFRGEAGAIYIITNNGAVTGPNGLPLEASGSAIDWIGNATLTYKMFKDTTFTLLASQSTGPSVVGSLYKSDILSAGLSYIINAHSTLSFSANYSQVTSTSVSDFASVSATYGYSFTPEWTAQLTYRYLHRFAVSGDVTISPLTNTPTVSGVTPADAHSIVVVFSHHATVLPGGN